MPVILHEYGRTKCRQAGGRGWRRRLPGALALSALLLGPAAACADGAACGWNSCSGDRALAAQVRARIDQHAALRVDQIDIHVLDHVAYLTGLVDTPLEEAEAVAAAGSVPNIGGVQDELAIRGNR